MGRSWVDPTGAARGGLGLAPVSAHADHESTGTVVSRPDPALRLPAPVGWEANDLRTELHDGARPLLTLEAGKGNRSGDGAERVLAGRVLGTRLHGPLLALNPELADLVLALATGRDEPWPALAAPAVERARRERVAEVRATSSPTGWRSRLPSRLTGRGH